jgi:hypothetical protein
LGIKQDVVGAKKNCHPEQAAASEAQPSRRRRTSGYPDAATGLSGSFYHDLRILHQRIAHHACAAMLRALSKPESMDFTRLPRKKISFDVPPAIAFRDRSCLLPSVQYLAG